MRRLTHITVLLLFAVPLTGCSKSREYYEMLGEQGDVSTLLSELKSSDPKVRANALTGLGIAAMNADPAYARAQDREPVDPAKLVPAVDPVITSLRAGDGFVRYCAGYALRHFAESMKDPQALTRITDALVEHMPPLDNGDDYKHYEEGLAAIAARADDAPELAAKAAAVLDVDRSNEHDPEGEK
ncbi:MAG: hypothetical protein O3B13_03955 [Planctomycetota bacterium]|nr:hypothetical protein [Planctomycetota bacterium]